MPVSVDKHGIVSSGCAHLPTIVAALVGSTEVILQESLALEFKRDAHCARRVRGWPDLHF